MAEFQIGKGELTLDAIDALMTSGDTLALADAARERVRACRAYLDAKVSEGGKAIYGVNTGFGSLCKVQIPADDLEQLQYNLIRSHACGTGPVIPDAVCRILLLLKIQNLSFGHSGVSVDTVWRLIDYFNYGILPVIFEQGSLGASGDLCPLSHMSMALIGEGDVLFRGERKKAGDVLRDHRLAPLKLQPKEGLALLNGTQFMSAYATYCILKAKKYMHLANQIAALSLDAFACKAEPFHASIHRIRNQNGQQVVAEEIRKILEGSAMFASEKEQVQDPYSFRCIPQVHGAVYDALEYCRNIIEREINGVTDNPNVFLDEDLVLSGGNFHGEPLALTLDFLAIALSELGNISERRVYRMLSGSRGLPEFLAQDAGLHSGLMIPQYVAAGLVSQNKQLCTPASVDSISSCNEQEDHVSMGANAATKCLRVVENIERILAIELLTAAQAFEYRRPATSSPQIEKLFNEYRKVVSFNTEDRFLHADIDATMRFVQTL